MSDIQIFIATFNRPELVLTALTSALKQDFHSFEVILSDNSSNNETENLVSGIEDRIFIYKKRRPSLPAIDHLNLILQEVTSEYFMIFHDDDVMHEDFIKILHQILVENDDVIAVGSNANVIRNGRKIRRRFNNRLKYNIKMESMEEMVYAYSKPSIVPFPGYLYRKEVAEKLRFDVCQGGKHSDAAFIINLLMLGSVIYVAEPLMDYYIHSEQDSKIYNFRDFSLLISYISRRMNLSRKHPVIRRMRIQNIYMEAKDRLLKQTLVINSRRFYLLSRVLCHHSLSEYFLKFIIFSIWSKLTKIKSKIIRFAT
jgi:glycosyltransferase involved in cell wall biosynthesis